MTVSSGLSPNYQIILSLTDHSTFPPVMNWPCDLTLRKMKVAGCALDGGQHCVFAIQFYIKSSSHGQGMLGIFQKLVASKAHDLEGFKIMEALMDNLPPDALQPYIKTVRISTPSLSLI